MILTKYMIYVKSKKHKNFYYLINLLNGSRDVIDDEEKNIINYWTTLKKEIFPKNEKERALYNELLNKGYLVESELQEKKIFEKTLNIHRTNYEMKKENINSITFVLTYGCNFACPYCYEKDNHNSLNILSEKQVDRIISLNKKEVKYVTFFGGEPFLPQNISIIKYIISKFPKASYAALTNGYYLEDIIQIIPSEKIDFFQVTLDGNEFNHNKTRILKDGNPTFKKILIGIEKCLQNNICIKIRMNISKKNIVECVRFREEYIKNHLSDFVKGNLLFEMQPIFQIKYDEKKKLEELLIESDVRLANYYGSELWKCNTILNTLGPIYSKGSKTITEFKYCYCNAELNSIFYDAEGYIYSCILAVGNSKAAIGRYYPEYEMYANTMWNRNIETIRKCNECKYALLCGGGCGLENLKTGNKIMDPNCKSLKVALDNLVMFYDEWIKEKNDRDN